MACLYRGRCGASGCGRETDQEPVLQIGLSGHAGTQVRRGRGSGRIARELGPAGRASRRLSPNRAHGSVCMSEQADLQNGFLVR